MSQGKQEAPSVCDVDGTPIAEHPKCPRCELLVGQGHYATRLTAAGYCDVCARQLSDKQRLEDTGIHRLACNVLEMALRDARAGKEDAQQWIVGRDPMFLFWCDAVDLEPDPIVNAVRRFRHYKGDHAVLIRA